MPKGWWEPPVEQRFQRWYTSQLSHRRNGKSEVLLKKRDDGIWTVLAVATSWAGAVYIVEHWEGALRVRAETSMSHACHQIDMTYIGSTHLALPLPTNHQTVVSMLVPVALSFGFSSRKEVIRHVMQWFPPNAYNLLRPAIVREINKRRKPQVQRQNNQPKKGHTFRDIAMTWAQKLIKLGKTIDTWLFERDL